MLLGNIIREYRKEHHLSLQDFANLIGTSRSYIHMLEKNINPSTNKPISPSIETLKSLANAMNMDVESLLKQLNSDKNKCLHENICTNIEPIVDIPILDSVRANFDYSSFNTLGTLKIDPNVITHNINEYFALNIEDDSMSPFFMEGDTIIIHKQSTCENNDYAVVIINDDEYILRMVKKSDFGIVLQPLNSKYKPIAYTNKEIESIPVKIVGIVVKSERIFRK